MDVFEQLESLQMDIDGVTKVKHRAESTLLKLNQKFDLLKIDAINILLKERDEGSTGHIVGNVVYAAKVVPQKLIVTDETKIPEKFFKVKKELNKADLNKAFKEGESIDGVTLDNGGFTLSRTAYKKG